MPASSYGWAGVALAILAALVWLWAFVRWIRRRGEEAQEAKDQIADLERKLDRSESARKKTQEVLDAARKVRDAPGPRVPTVSELRQPPGGPGPPA